MNDENVNSDNDNESEPTEAQDEESDFGALTNDRYDGDSDEESELEIERSEFHGDENAIVDESNKVENDIGNAYSDEDSPELELDRNAFEATPLDESVDEVEEIDVEPQGDEDDFQEELVAEEDIHLDTESDTIENDNDVEIDDEYSDESVTPDETNELIGDTQDKPKMPVEVTGLFVARRRTNYECAKAHQIMNARRRTKL